MMQKIHFWKSWYKYQYRIKTKLITKWFRLKNWPLVSIHPKAYVETNVVLRPFWSKDYPTLLHIELKAYAHIKHSVTMQGNGKLIIGEHSYIGSYSVIGVNEQISIGKNVMIADGATIRDTDHQIARTDIPMQYQGMTSQPVVIEDDVWLGHGVSILRGVKIGKGSVIAAGAVVTQNIPPGVIAGGIPAKILKYRDITEVLKA